MFCLLTLFGLTGCGENASDPPKAVAGAATAVSLGTNATTVSSDNSSGATVTATASDKSTQIPLQVVGSTLTMTSTTPTKDSMGGAFYAPAASAAQLSLTVSVLVADSGAGSDRFPQVVAAPALLRRLLQLAEMRSG